MSRAPDHDTDSVDEPETIDEPRLWRDHGWTVRVSKNQNDDGWAVEVIKQGKAEPALVGPRAMGRDKKNPKPPDTSAFQTLVKTASQVLRRHEQQPHAKLGREATLELPAHRRLKRHLHGRRQDEPLS